MFSVVSKIILSLSVIKYGTTVLIIGDRENHKFNYIADTATQLANDNFNYRLQTVILSKDIDGVLVDNFLKEFKGTVVIEVKRDGIPPEQVVIFIESLKSFRNVLDILKPDLKGKSLLHSRAKFIIVLLNRSHRIEQIFIILWSYYVTNVVILMGQKKKMTALYTYYPYRNNTDCQNTQPFLLGIVKEKHPIKVNIYPDKMKNMQQCPFYISTNKLYHSLTKQKIQLQIVTETMVELLQKAMNFTPILTTKDYLSIIDSDQDRNWSESLDDVITGVTNVSTCSISIGVQKLSLLDYSFPYFRMRIVWLAPPTRPGHVWLRLLSPLNGYMWLILLIVILFLKSISFILRIKSIEKKCHRYFIGINKLRGAAFRIWGVMVGQPVKVAPKRFRDFYIVGLWIWFAFVIRSAYQSVLIGALKTETVVGNYESLRNAYEHGYKYGGRVGMLLYFEHDSQILEEYEIVPEIRFEELFNQVLEGKRKFVFATSLEYAWAYCLSRGIMEDECGHVLSDSIMTIPLVVWMKKNSPFLEILSMWLQRFLESGLLEINTKPVTPVASEASSDPSPLTRNQTLSCFVCLLVGYTVSFLLFCLEKFNFITRRI